MRSFEGQFSDNQPIRRNAEQKRRALAQMEAELAALPAKATPTLRESLIARIKSMKAEIEAGPSGRDRDRDRDRDRGYGDRGPR